MAKTLNKMQQTAGVRLGYLLGFIVLVVFGGVVFDSFKSAYPNHDDDFLFDPYLTKAKPQNKFIQNHPFLKQAMTLTLSLGMDTVGLCLMYLFCFKQDSSYFIPAVITVQLVRAVALNIVIFPVPETFIFESPGLSSVSTAFDRTNDFYFSGHVATTTIFMCDSIFYKRRVLSCCLVLFVIYTMTFLVLHGVHYTNDLVIGFVAAVTVCKVVYTHRHSFSLAVLSVFGKTCRAFDCYKEIIERNTHSNMAKEVPDAESRVLSDIIQIRQ